MDKLTLNSYAKLNLYLEVLNRRADKFHNIKTLFEKIDLADRITLKNRKSPGIRVVSNSPHLPKDQTKNLAYRAARLVIDCYAPGRGVDITINKRIPVGAGLGGGSSNAAAVLLGLNRLWGLGLSRAKLFKLSDKLGSDVTFFIHKSAFGLGISRGERIKELKSLQDTRLWHLLVVPRIHVSTPSIYKCWDKLKKSAKTAKIAALTRPEYDVKILILAIKNKDLSLAGPAMFNSLQQVTVKAYPAVGRIIEALVKLGFGAVLMSGSGPAVFAILPSQKEAATLARIIKARHKDCSVFITRTLT